MFFEFLSGYVCGSLLECSTFFVENIMVGNELRGDHSAGDLRALARKSRDAKQAKSVCEFDCTALPYSADLMVYEI